MGHMPSEPTPRFEPEPMPLAARAVETAAPSEPAADEAPRPSRRGWWQRRFGGE
jgi:hypothetical protein